MAQRRFIVLGDKTSHGGTVISARGAGRVPFYIDGKPVACVGDPVICPRCKGVHRILTGADDPPVWLDGALVAVENGKVSDGAVLMSIQQFHASYGDDGVSAAAAYQAAVAQMAKSAANVEQAVAAEKDFCLECWRNALEQRRGVMAL